MASKTGMSKAGMQCGDSRPRYRNFIFWSAVLLAATTTLGQKTARTMDGVRLPEAHLSGPAAAKAQRLYSALPLLFEQNPNPQNLKTHFWARTPDFTLFLSRQDAVLARNGGGKSEPALRLRWLGSDDQAVLSGGERIGGRTNYLIGNKPSQWQTGIANFQQVKIGGLYPGVDLVYYGNHNQLEYDLRVASGADPDVIRMKIEGAHAVRIEKASGDLVGFDGKNEFRLHKPVAYQQETAQDRRAVAASYVLSSRNTVSFRLGGYDRTRPLVIDPYVVYSTVFGGTNAGNGDLANDQILGMAVDTQGDVYLMGTTNTIDMPTTNGAFQGTCTLSAAKHCSSYWVAKFDPTQSGAASLIYATYISGDNAVETDLGVDADIDFGSQPNDLAVDNSGDVYFAGYSTANDYPTTPSAYAPTSVNGTGVVTELSPTGTALVYSSFIPLAQGAMVAVDSKGVVYVIGDASSGLVTTDGSSCTIFEGCVWPFLAAYDTTKSGTASLVYSEYIPMDGLAAIAVDSSDNVYLGGQISLAANNGTLSGLVSKPFPVNGFQTTNTSTGSNSSEPFFARLNSTGAATYGTYVGTYVQDLEEPTSISVANNGVATIGGNTSLPFPLVNPITSTPPGINATAFVAEIDTTQTGTNSLLYSTFIPSNNSTDRLYISSVANNSTGKILFSGLAQLTSDITQINPVTEPSATYIADVGDGFIGQLDPSQTGANALEFLSLLGGVQFPYYISYDPSGNVIVGGFAESFTKNLFISTPGTYETSVGNLNNPPFFYKISMASTSSLTVSPSSLTFSSQIINTTSAAQTVTVQNSGATAVTFSSIVASASFAETDDCAPSLAANSSCTIDVTFTPTASGAATGTLTLTDSDSSSPQTVALSGTGTSGTPQAVLTPASLSFGNQTSGTISTAQVVVLSNPGTTTLTNIAVTIAGANASAFADTSACGATLDAGADCNISVVFSPATVGTFTAQLSVSDSASGSPQTVALTGTGTAPPAPIATLSPASLSFGNQPQGTTSAAQTVTLSNTGNAVLTIGGIVIAGTNPSDFAETNNCGASLAAGSSCILSVTFTPASAASFAATISVTDNAAASPQTTALSGAGTSPSDFALSAEPPAQSVTPGEAANFTVDVTPVNGAYENAVALTAAGLPAGTTASFAPPSVTPGSAGATSVLTIQPPPFLASLAPLGRIRGGTALFATGLLLMLLPLRRMRKLCRRRLSTMLLFAALALGTAMSLSGCNGGYFGPPPQTYTVTITGTSGSTQHSTTVTLTVQ